MVPSVSLGKTRHRIDANKQMNERRFFQFAPISCFTLALENQPCGANVLNFRRMEWFPPSSATGVVSPSSAILDYCLLQIRPVQILPEEGTGTQTVTDSLFRPTLHYLCL